MFKLIGKRLKRIWECLTTDEQAAERWLHGAVHFLGGFALSVWITTFREVTDLAGFFAKVQSWHVHDWLANVGAGAILTIVGLTRPLVPTSLAQLLGADTAPPATLPPPVAAVTPSQPPPAGGQ